MQDDLRVGGRLKDRTVPNQFGLQLARIDEVPVVADGDLPIGTIDQDRLGVVEPAVARGGIADVPDCEPARQPFQRLFREGIGHMAHRLRDPDPFAV